MVELLEITNNSWRMQGEHGHGVRTLPFPKTSRTATGWVPVPTICMLIHIYKEHPLPKDISCAFA